MCPAVYENGTCFFNESASSSSVQGVCINGTGGNVTRECNMGVWGPIQGECRKCAAEVIDYAIFPDSDVNEYVNGTCACGYTGAPRMFCDANGNWCGCAADACKRNTLLKQNSRTK